MELTKKFLNNPIRILKDSNFEFYCFLDYAETRSLADITNSVDSKNSYLGSHGLGIRINDMTGFSLDLMAAEARNTFSGSDVRENPRYILSLTKSF